MGFLPQMSAGGPFGALSGGNTPQDWGQGIQNAPFTPYSTGPGTVPGQQSPDPNFNFSTPGAGENYFQQHQGAFGQPTQSGQYWQQVRGQAQSHPQGTNYSAQEYNNFTRPDIAADPGLNPYYDRAASRLSEGLNREFASRGMMGSSSALDALGEGLGGLAAEQANREAAYNLQRLGEQRNWEQLGGQLAGQADQNSRANSMNELGWLQGMGNLAGQADQTNLANLMGGGQLALGAQEAMRGRGQDFFNNLLQASGMMGGMTGNAYNDMFQNDAQQMMNAIMLETGLAQAALQGSLYNQGRQKDDASWAKGMLSPLSGKMGGGGGR